MAFKFPRIGLFPNKKVETKESRERGANVEILIDFIRHGERDLDGSLNDLGRKITHERGHEAKEKLHDKPPTAVKAIGSPAGPKQIVDGRKFARATETAHIYASEIAGDEMFQTRIEERLSFESLITPAPYKHQDIYNAHYSLPENYDSLSVEEQEKARIAAARKAQTITIQHLASIDSPQAEAFRRESAGAFASLLLHYQRMAKRLNNGARVLIPAGTHGSQMEWLPYYALITERKGKEKTGLSNLDEIGGSFSPSEGYRLSIATDEKGSEKNLILTFSNPTRPQKKFRLDLKVVRELADFYEQLHAQNHLKTTLDN